VRRRVVIALAAAAVAALPAQAAAPPSRMLVTAREFSLVSSRQVLVVGRAIIQFHNAGEDPHDLALRRIRRGHLTGRAFRFPETRSGELSQRTVKLRPGRWRLWCTLPGHKAAGMVAKLRVERR
jgi:hypothetical protein